MDHYTLGLKFTAAGQHVRAIEEFERALGLNPDDTRTLFALGNTARALGLKPAAEDFYRRVLALEPQRLEAIVNLANLLRSSAQFAAAEALLQPALAQTPDSVDLLLALGSTKREQGKSDEAIALYRQALAQSAGFVPALVNLADLLADGGDDDEALVLYDRALKSDSRNAQARLNRAILYLLRGQLKEGWRDYAARLTLAGKVPLPDHGLKRWSGESLKRTRLLVSAEQGVGDHLMFASLIPELAARAAAEGGSVILECEPRLRVLFARSFPTVVTHDWDIETRDGVLRTHYGWLKTMGGANAAIEMGSLPRILRKTIEAFPTPHAYLVADEAEAALWGAEFANLPRPLVGLCWRSGSVGGERARQYAPLEAWADFVAALPGTAICAQYDAKPDEIAALSGRSGKTIIVPQGLDQKRELDRTAALFASLDAMVTAPTAVSWLAAGLGLPTCKILYDTSWTSFSTHFEPFAPSAQCLMPRRSGDWADVLGQALETIRSLPV
ncbi:MAG: tetratricopeptide repeat protein [Rhizomicrobium sp.]|nr:tetratricopeptide repeat protein [Rhizomicrobium sp.]